MAALQIQSATRRIHIGHNQALGFSQGGQVQTAQNAIWLGVNGSLPVLTRISLTPEQIIFHMNQSSRQSSQLAISCVLHFLVSFSLIKKIFLFV